MTPARADVVVVGAGPAGCAAAITLARAGRQVVVIDKARFPRDKCCGDGLTTGALRLLEHLGLSPTAVASWTPVNDVWIRSPSTRVGYFPLPQDRGTYGAVARRTDLDAALVDLARQAGATVAEGQPAAQVRSDPGEMTISIEAGGLGTITARYLIGADGMWSPLRRLLGVADEPGYHGEWHAVRQYFTDVTGPAARELWVVFEPDLLPGYVWSFPLAGGRANVGFGILRTRSHLHGAQLAKLWPELLSRDHIRALLGPGARPESAYRAWPIPTRLGHSALSAAGGRALFVGDAARAGDPMTGEGIAQALETGVLAARSLLRAGAKHPGSAAASYQRAVATGMALDNNLAGLLGRALAHRKGAAGAIRVASSTPWRAGHFARWMFEDYPRALPLTPWRWGRHGFNQPGAWAKT
jgi:geranylgeranyl reductase family protein